MLCLSALIFLDVFLTQAIVVTDEGRVKQLADVSRHK